ncbi:Hypothetical predicted protein, partial [Paramuricea clavata]
TGHRLPLETRRWKTTYTRFEVWVEDREKEEQGRVKKVSTILYEYYRKDVASKAVINARLGAQGLQSKARLGGGRNKTAMHRPKSWNKNEREQAKDKSCRGDIKKKLRDKGLRSRRRIRVDRQDVTELTALCAVQKGKESVIEKDSRQTARSAYTRGVEHVEALEKKNERSVLWRHCEEKHDNEIQEFRMSVTGMYNNDVMARHIAESVRISKVPEGQMNDIYTKWRTTDEVLYEIYFTEQNNKAKRMHKVYLHAALELIRDFSRLRFWVESHLSRYSTRD